MNAMKLVSSLLISLACAHAQAATPILDSTLASFAVLGGSSVTNTGPTTLTGDLGVINNSSPTGITGFYGTLANDGPGTVTGSIHQGDAFAMTAGVQLAGSISTLDQMGSGTLLGSDLTGDILAPGVYTVPAGTTNLTGTLTLNGGGNADAVWVFQMPSTLITSTGAIVNVINAGAGAGVYWNVGSSATLGTNTTFAGNILANTSITMSSGVTLNGRALALTGDVTMINDTVNVAAVPEPDAYILMLAGLGLISVVLRRRAVSRRQRVPDGTYFSTLPVLKLAI
jgi:hypothetical protein